MKTKADSFTPPQVEKGARNFTLFLLKEQMGFVNYRNHKAPSPQYYFMKTQNKVVTLCVFLFYFQKIPSSKLVEKNGIIRRLRNTKGALFLRGTLFIPRYHEALHSKPSRNGVPQQNGYSECSHPECW